MRSQQHQLKHERHQQQHLEQQQLLQQQQQQQQQHQQQQFRQHRNMNIYETYMAPPPVDWTSSNSDQDILNEIGFPMSAPSVRVSSDVTSTAGAPGSSSTRPLCAVTVCGPTPPQPPPLATLPVIVSLSPPTSLTMPPPGPFYSCSNAPTLWQGPVLQPATLSSVLAPVALPLAPTETTTVADAVAEATEVAEEAAEAIEATQFFDGQTIPSRAASSKAASHTLPRSSRLLTSTHRFEQPVESKRSEHHQQKHERHQQLHQQQQRCKEDSAVTEKKNEIITVAGQTGVWTNRSDEANWTGCVPLADYPISNDPQPELVRKLADYQLAYKQEVLVRYLRPPTPPASGEIRIVEEPAVPCAEAPPIVLCQQQCSRARTPPPLVIREAPPCAPRPCEPLRICIAGKRLPPPPRKLIVERLAAKPVHPPQIVVERWLAYKPQTRRVVFERAPAVEPAALVRNVIIQWDAPHVTVSREINSLGVSCADPADYAAKYADSLVEARDLPEFVRAIVPPPNVVLACEAAVRAAARAAERAAARSAKSKPCRSSSTSSSSSSSSCSSSTSSSSSSACSASKMTPCCADAQVEGDVFALDLIDLDKAGLGHLRCLTAKAAAKCDTTDPAACDKEERRQRHRHNRNNNKNNDATKKAPQLVSKQQPQAAHSWHSLTERRDDPTFISPLPNLNIVNCTIAAAPPPLPSLPLSAAVVGAAAALPPFRVSYQHPPAAATAAGLVAGPSWRSQAAPCSNGWRSIDSIAPTLRSAANFAAAVNWPDTKNGGVYSGDQNAKWTNNAGHYCGRN